MKSLSLIQEAAGWGPAHEDLTSPGGGANEARQRAGEAALKRNGRGTSSPDDDEARHTIQDHSPECTFHQSLCAALRTSVPT